jgi:hypothetical protein
MMTPFNGGDGGFELIKPSRVAAGTLSITQNSDLLRNSVQ